MKFTYQAYREMLKLLKQQGYAIENYHTWQSAKRCAILRHDVDNSLEKAVALAEVEAEEGAHSTYFVLLRTDFYNVASLNSLKMLRKILDMGHEIGLHFDEVAYGQTFSTEKVIDSILKERYILSALLDTPVSTVSMHRPSKATLESDLQIPGMVNSYGKTFFHDFKYLSDSRRNWREPVLDIIRSQEYDRLHILTHGFWYCEQETDIKATICNNIEEAKRQRYTCFAENIRDFDDLKIWI